MTRASSPSYVVEFKLKLEPYEMHKLDKAFEIARIIYNTCLSMALKRSNQLKQTKEFNQLRKLPPSKERTKKFSALEQYYEFTEYSLHASIVETKKYFGHLGINEVQKLMTRAFKAVQKVHYGQAKNVRFKRKDEIVSIENKSNKTGLREKDGKILFQGLKMTYHIKTNDCYAQLTCLDKTKYARLVKRIVRGKMMYFVQLIKEGTPPMKQRKTKDGTVGIDIGTSTIAVVAEDQAFFEPLIEKEQTLKAKQQEIRLLQRKLDRSKRATNPHKFNEDGSINLKNKDPWAFSNRYDKNRKALCEMHRKVRLHRKMSHEQLANRIIALGNTVKVEQMSFSGLQKRSKVTTIHARTGRINKKKRFGGSLLNYAPATLLEIIHRKLAYHGEQLIKVNTYKVKASQYNHITKTYQKKSLSQRWNNVNDKKIHRDLYAAFLIRHVCEKDRETIQQVLCEQHYPQFLIQHQSIFGF